jgi:hypothetical protein
VKVLIHRPRYIDPAVVPEFGIESSSAAEAIQTAPIVQSAEEPTVVPKVPTVGPTVSKDDKAKEPQAEETMKMSEILSPSTEAKLPKAQKTSVATPKRRRMASVLDAVIETMKALSPAPKKITEAIKIQDEAEAGRAETEAGQTKAEARPLVPSETKAAAPEDKADLQTSETDLTVEQDMAERAKETLLPKRRPKLLIIFIDMLQGRNCPKMKSRKQGIMLKN